MPIAIGTILIFSFFFANNVRTASPIAIGRGTDRCVSTSGRLWCLLGIDRWHLAHADWHNPHFFSFFASNVRTAGPIGMGEALIDVFRSREDGGAC